MTTPPLHLPSGINYECTRCGRSCGEFWEIKVEPEIADSIRNRPAEALREAGAADPSSPVVPSPWTPGTLMMRPGPDGHCCLQGADGLCTLHKIFGFASKPNRCRTFPYRFIETPRGTYCGLTFACSAVLNNQGPAVADQRGEIEDLFGWTLSRRAVEAPNELASGIPLTWEQYEAVEQDLADLLEPALAPIGERLLMQYHYLHLLIKLVRADRENTSRQFDGPEANTQAIEVFRHRVREGDWALLRGIAGRRPKSGLLRRMILGFAHALRNTYGRRSGRLSGYAMVLKTYFTHGFGHGSIDMPALGKPVAYRKMKTIGFDPARPEFDELLTRYFRHRIQRKDLLLADSVQFGLQLQLLHWGLIHWYAAALAADRGAHEVGWEHLTEAVRIVEKYFVLHSTFDQLFKRMPLLRLFLDRLLEHPLYAFTMARGEWCERQ
ncbi:MAG: hypothetical protein ABFD69_16810 [Candidatus Sumerlaeia bacterium]